ncbi:hypothetical protein NPIL_473631 [Nephila pilipes]|uniref:Uncharacterized protein n=1 Tax=Nephila pilipes TaxID=299642 RepID=A0A8X6N1I5_NEPPI|nr:hypothetical protein NPIL_473631 [Nephila pilipes]
MSPFPLLPTLFPAKSLIPDDAGARFRIPQPSISLLHSPPTPWWNLQPAIEIRFPSTASNAHAQESATQPPRVSGPAVHGNDVLGSSIGPARAQRWPSVRPSSAFERKRTWLLAKRSAPCAAQPQPSWALYSAFRRASASPSMANTT